MNRPTKAFWASLASFVLGGLPLIQPSVFKLSWFRHGLLTPRFRAVALGVCFALAATVGVAAGWQGRFGCPVLVAETFVDPQRFRGTCYKSAGWEQSGETQGYGRDWQDFYPDTRQPKQLWVRPSGMADLDQARAVE